MTLKRPDNQSDKNSAVQNSPGSALADSNLQRSNSTLSTNRSSKNTASKKTDSNFDYKDAGVDVEAGDALVDWLQDQDRLAKSKGQNLPWQDRIVSGVGGFASLFRIGNFTGIHKPCLVTCTDGVGTKVKLASQFHTYEGVAQDCVAMCVNDLICTGGMPLLFLDYYATGKLNLKAAQSFLAGMKQACAESLCALVGGETAEMPGVYQDNDFDCAGFAVGIVDEDQAWGAHKVKAGDRLLGVSSSGFHSNGYSLLRQIFKTELSDTQHPDHEKWKRELLIPTALYVQLVQKLKVDCEVHAAAHITGGGIENIPRVLPEGLHWEMQTWPLPETFKEVQRRTGLTDDQIRKTLNCGLGFVFILAPESFDRAKSHVEACGFRSFDLGRMQEKVS